MDHPRIVVNLLAIWLVFQTSAMMTVDKWDVEKLNDRLQDPSKDGIDLDCDACVILVDMVQFLARQNASEDEIVAAVTKYCIITKIEDTLVCTQVVREFMVSLKHNVSC